MSSFWNHNITVSIFGESHGPAIGVVIDNLPPGEHIDLEELRSFMARRAPKKDATSTQRSEKDLPNIMSGVHNGYTTGTPLAAFINNTDQHSQDYGNISKLARPGHADYTGALRYKGFNDVRGGGHFSGRLTAPLCFAGAICGQILERRGIYTGTHIAQIHNIKDTKFNPLEISREQIIALRHKKFPTISDKKGQAMYDDIDLARRSLDSLGGIVECAVTNVPAGVGSPIFEGLENSIAQIVFGIPAVKGIEFGAGHSLGEYAAMVASGVLSFKDGFRVIKARAAAMQKAAENQHGVMCAVMGQTPEDIEKICSSVDGYVTPVNYNSAVQTVIAGEPEAVDTAIAKFAEIGAKTIKLKVSAAFHSKLMQPAADEFEAELRKMDVTFSKPNVTFFSNLYGAEMPDFDNMPEKLAKHIVSPVKFTSELALMQQQGYENFVELGPNKVLTGLVKKTLKDVNAVNVENAKTLEKALELLK